MYKLITLAIAFFVFHLATKAQDLSKTNTDTLPGEVRKIKSDLDIIKKIKLSAYVQSQFQWAEAKGISSFAGGDFPANSNNRFKVRRAEFKTMYDNGTTQVVANIDITQNGVNIKDAYGKFKEQKYKTFSLTAGIFNRPFGFEVPYSSGLLESPERARVNQVLFPGERDGGAMLGFQKSIRSKLNSLRIEAGMFNGTGNSANDFDSKKDFIGNIHWCDTIKSKTFAYALGVSHYNGGFANGTKFIYSNITTLPNGNPGFQVDSADGNKSAISKKVYTSADFQINIVWAAGSTILRGEYIMGQQAGLANSTLNLATQPTTDTYIRQFEGAYFYLVQSILKTKHQLVLKYDWYDPNTKVSGNNIGKAGSKLTSADLKYTTIGLGWVYNMNPNLKWTIYYDMVTNETSENLNGFNNELKDNVFTLRAQFRF